MKEIRKKLLALFILSRPAFHTVGLLPFILGNVIAWNLKNTFRLEILALGFFGTMLVMMSTYIAGEYWDYEEDSLSSSKKKSKFAGGSQVIQKKLLPRRIALYSSLMSLSLALIVGLILQFGYRTGPLTIPLGAVGILGGFFYSTKPIRWVSRGVGELWIAFCYGWLPVAVGYYLQAGSINPVVHWIAFPIGLTIFNVILLNEFLDYREDASTVKRNLVVRFGREKATYLYSAVAALSWITVLLSTSYNVPSKLLLFYIPVFILSLFLVGMLNMDYWKNSETLEKMCGLNIVVNLGTTSAFIFSFLG